MGPERKQPGTTEFPSDKKHRRYFWINVLRGAVATFVIGVIPFIQFLAPVAGGAVAGYLQTTNVIDGVKVGSLAGAIGGVGLNFLTPPRFFGLLGDPVGDGTYQLIIVFGLVVWVGTSAFGGAIGAKTATRRFNEMKNMKKT